MLCPISNRRFVPISNIEDANHTDESKRMPPALISTPISIDKTAIRAGVDFGR
jgi:hypothetical protein